MKRLLLAALLATALPASAGTILVFGQQGTAQTINTTAVDTNCVSIGPLCETDITGTNIPVTITAINAGISVPVNAFLTLGALSTDGATQFGAGVFQDYAGSFEIFSGLNQTGTNFLSATFTDLVAGLLSSQALSLSSGDPPDNIHFTSDVIASLSMPTALSFSFTNVQPGVAECSDGVLGHRSTICSFTSNVSGNDSATVPEPGTILLLGVAMAGLGWTRRRKT
jgi:hypothetical protein